MMEKKKDNSKTIIVFLSIVLLITIGVAGFYFITSKSDGGNELKREPNVVTSEGDKGKTFEEMQATTDASKIGVSMNINPVFKNSSSTGNILLKNTSSNGNAFVANIVLENGDEVYKSGLIEKGTQIDEIKLTKDLLKGEYPAIVYFTSYNKEDQKIGTSGINIKIIIQE